jgi:pimeloyl-ACP methyl ester carboxylesterase
MPPGMELRSVTLHGHGAGLRLAGEGNTPVLVLIHGLTSSSATWKRVGSLLAERFTVVAPDLLGHGRTAKLPGDYSLGAHASFLRDLLLVLGHERATLVGHSFGGGVAMQFAYQFPERCERLVLVGSGGLGREVSPLLRALALPAAELVLPLFCQAALSDAANAVAGWIRRMGFRPTPATEEICRGYASLTEPRGRVAFFRTLRAVIDVDGQSVSATDRLELAADLPTLIVWGDGDRIIPVDHAHRAHAAIPGSRLAVFPGVGHFPHREAPKRFASLVSEFVAATDPARLSDGLLRSRLRAPA